MLLPEKSSTESECICHNTIEAKCIQSTISIFTSAKNVMKETETKDSSDNWPMNNALDTITEYQK
jgi:hypothetical protein